MVKGLKDVAPVNRALVGGEEGKKARRGKTYISQAPTISLQQTLMGKWQSLKKEKMSDSTHFSLFFTHDHHEPQQH